MSNHKNLFFEIYMKFDKNQEILFFIKNIFGKVSVPSESMNGGDLSKRLVELSISKRVLEFGSGGSTIIFANKCNSLISVESDFFYARKVKKIVERFAHVEIFWVNIGPTKSFGNPISSLETIFRNRWHKYSMRPWIEGARNVDLVFIDGRFRVSCAMQCFLNIDCNFVLVFDDYFSRNEYHSVELFLGKPIERLNDTALFEIPDHFSRQEISSEIMKELQKYTYDYR
jgi:hypothetical protein